MEKYEYWRYWPKLLGVGLMLKYAVLHTTADKIRLV